MKTKNITCSQSNTTVASNRIESRVYDTQWAVSTLMPLSQIVSKPTGWLQKPLGSGQGNICTTKRSVPVHIVNRQLEYQIERKKVKTKINKRKRKQKYSSCTTYLSKDPGANDIYIYIYINILSGILVFSLGSISAPKKETIRKVRVPRVRPRRFPMWENMLETHVYGYERWTK